MSVARHHAEWLSLVEVSGPFLSMKTLLDAFPQGLDDVSSEVRGRIREAFGEWQDEGFEDAAIHREWVRFVLREALEFDQECLFENSAESRFPSVKVPEHGEVLVPDLVVRAPGEKKPALLIRIVPPAQNLDGPLLGTAWKASPLTRMMTLLHGTEIPLGLVTNGQRFTLVHAPAGETTTFASFYAHLFSEEPLVLRAFTSLLGARRFFGVPADETLSALLVRSLSEQHEVTDQLGLQVRRAVEILIQTFDRLDRESGGELLAGFDEKRLYESAVTVMMRLVFLFAAEERELLPVDQPLYQEHYAVSTILAQLEEKADRETEEVLERRHDAWSRLLATFRAVHGGVKHEGMRLPAHGGSLFDPDRFPFLEGRARDTSWKETPSVPLAIDNRTVLHLLRALQILEIRVAGGGPAEARRLSFRALDVEQIGHVYEGLLDHTAIRAQGPVLGLAGTKNKTPEVELLTLEEHRERSEDALLKFLNKQTGSQPQTLEKRLGAGIVAEEIPRWRVACDNDDDLLERVKPWAGLVREDSHGDPVVFPPASLYVGAGQDRRSTGTHYTPKSLTEPIVRYTLEPLVYEGPAEGWDKEKWKLKSAKELLDLKICDMAMGSGAFLVQVCRYLSERLVEAWEEVEKEADGRLVVTPEGELSTGDPTERPLPRSPEERLTIARRIVADRCLYGVDKNPMAVEMAKLSLWLTTLQKDRPFTFLDHAFRAGDSLLGLTDERQIERFHINPEKGRQVTFANLKTREALAKARELREQLQSFTVESIADAEEKERLLAKAEEAVAGAKLIADLVTGAALSTAAKGPCALEDRLSALEPKIAEAFVAGADGERMPRLSREAHRLLHKGQDPEHPLRVPFHWCLEFPEVVGQGGFSGIVGNPPFQGGQRITGALGVDYRDHLVEHLGWGKRGSADLCAYFFLRGAQHLRSGGQLGMLATNTIAQGDTREVGLDQLSERGYTIPRAIPSRAWPGEANLEVAQVWLRRNGWKRPFVLDDREVEGITSFLVRPGRVTGKPYRLAANAGKSFIGSYVLGMGFVMSPEEAAALIEKDERNRDVLYPYMNGQDLNSRPDQSPSRWVINFHDWPLDRDTAPEGFLGPVAADYPDCLSIIRETVKPERDKNNRKVYRERWWHYAEKRPELYATMRGMKWVLARSRVSNLNSVARVPTSIVASEATVVFALQDAGAFAVLQGFAHTCWLEEHASTMRTDIRYTPSDCLETFPFPTPTPTMEEIEEAYYCHRLELMTAQDEGLTKTYNRYHTRSDLERGIQTLRGLHVAMDEAVAAAYRWSDLNLDHDFHETKRGTRFTISEKARREALDRLLELNHQRYADEVEQGLHEKRKQKAKPPLRATKAEEGRMPLFDGLQVAESSPPDTGEFAAALLAAIREARKPLGKADLIALTGIPPSRWLPLIGGLKDSGQVIQEGTRRTARYRPAEEGR